MKTYSIISLPFAIALVGCGGGGGHNHGHGHHGHGHGADEPPPEVITLSETAIRKNNVQVTEVSTRIMQPTFSVPARVAFNEEKLAHVGALINGRVSQMKAHIGETVEAGSVLFEITSPELGLAQNAYIQAMDAEASAKAAIALAESNAAIAKAEANVKAAATRLLLAEKSAGIKEAEAEVKSAEAHLAFAENSAAVNKAKADLRTATASVALANNNATIAAAQGQIDAALPVLTRTRELFESGRKLAASGAIAKAELARRESVMLTAEAEVKTARSLLAHAKAELARDMQTAAAAEQAALAALTQAQAQQTRDITTAKAKEAASKAVLIAASAKWEQDKETAKAVLAAARDALLAAHDARKKDLAKATNDLKAATAEVAITRNQLELYGMGENRITLLEQNRKLEPLYLVRAPRDGTVVEREVTLGENVGSDRPHLLILADLSDVWILMDIPPVRAAEVAKDQAVQIYDPETRSLIEVTAPGSANPVNFKLDYISPVMDTQTRTVQARIEVPNQGGILRPGQFLTVQLNTGQPRNQLAIPTGAIQYVDEKPTVYVFTGKPLTYKRRTVKVGIPINGWIPVLAGLKEGEKVVTHGSFVLKAEFGKAGAGHDHSH
tara:strand:- start:3 stop:1844 length:1842 start_codon:yes stop_codon:yes gene_type:complete